MHDQNLNVDFTESKPYITYKVFFGDIHQWVNHKSLQFFKST